MPFEPTGGARAKSAEVGIVIIGRNEGRRLIGCLASARTQVQNLVYVDLGSTDGSPAAAERMGVTVVRLDMSEPFTAARGRNAGYATLKAMKPDICYVQFVDGDCELVPGWLDAAFEFLEKWNEVAVVCGRRRERHPQQSIYNRLCDIEWDTPVGQAVACGGDAMMRAAAFETVGGFRAELVAGEEPELCLRLRQAGWKIWRIDAEMTLHDASMLRFGQCWRRAVRCGQSDAEISWNDSHRSVWVREKRALVASLAWSGILPLTIGIGSFFYPAALAGVLLYPLQVCRIALLRGPKSADAWAYGLFMVLLKFATFQGNIIYYLHHLRGKPIELIEYKQTR